MTAAAQLEADASHSANDSSPLFFARMRYNSSNMLVVVGSSIVTPPVRQPVPACCSMAYTSVLEFILRPPVLARFVKMVHRQQLDERRIAAGIQCRQYLALKPWNPRKLSVEPSPYPHNINATDHFTCLFFV